MILKYRRALIIIIFIMISGLFINNVNVYGDEISYNDNKSAYYKPLEVLLDGSYENTSYQKIKAVTGYNGVESNQLVYSFIQNQTADSKVVTWAVKKDSGKLKNANLPAIAIDYEANHDDWVVTCGINADQYTTGFGTNVASNGKDFYSPQTYYPFICDSEGWFAISPLPYYGHNVAGFLQDGSNDPIVSGSASLNNGEIKLAGIFLYILDEDGNRVQKFEINKINESPRALETTLWTSYYTGDNEFPDIKIAQKTYAVMDAERAYATNSIDYATFKDQNAYNAFFGKGSISNIGENQIIGYGDFAIETNNEYIESYLDTGVNILVQYEYEGPLSAVESATGYHSIQKMNGADVEGLGDYNTLPYPRSVVGRTSDGKIVLLAVDGKAPKQGRTGTRHWETNAILNSLGVVEAYQMDGGGSVTAIIRNQKGGFDVINNPADGSARSVLTGLLFVERKKPEVKNKIINVLRNEISFDYSSIDDHGNDISKIVLSFDNIDYELNKDNLVMTFSDLKLNYDYEYSLKVYIDEAEVIIDSGSTQTIPNKPEIISITEESDCLFNIEFNDIDNTLIEYYVIIDEDKFYPENNLVKTKVLKKGKTFIIYKYKMNEKEFEEKVILQPYKFIDEIDNSINKINAYLKDIYN